MHDEHALPGTDVVVDGVRLHVVRHGRDGHPGDAAVLFVHGLGEGFAAGFDASAHSGRLWSDVARDLEHQRRSVIPDLAGCGRSEHPGAVRSTAAAQARMLRAVLDEFGHRSAVVVAHDIGGLVAAELVRYAPDHVRAVVLVGTPLHGDVWPPSDTVPAIVPGIGTAYAALRTRSWTTGRGLHDVIAGIDGAALDSARNALAASAVPRIVLWGEDDVRLSPAYGRRLADDLGAAWVPVAGAGHLLPAERPERVAEEVEGFLADLPADLVG
jgi:pimeloyl-ACP methyl ester carboxylesterase